MNVVFDYQGIPLGSLDLQEVPRVGDDMTLHLQHYPIRSGEPVLCTARVVRRSYHLHGCFLESEIFKDALFLPGHYMKISIEPMNLDAIHYIEEQHQLQSDGWGKMVQKLAQKVREEVVDA